MSLLNPKRLYVGGGVFETCRGQDGLVYMCHEHAMFSVQEKERGKNTQLN